MANYPEERGIIMLNVRIASPPPRDAGRHAAGQDVVLHLQPEARRRGHDLRPLTVSSSPRKPTPRCASSAAVRAWRPCAPTSSTSSSASTPTRKVTFWYGARSRREVVLRRPLRLDRRRERQLRVASGLVGAVARRQLGRPTPASSTKSFTTSTCKDHPAPEDIEYYFCGPPMMLKACMQMLDDLGCGAREHPLRRLRFLTENW